jgi:hypothetical protein
MDLSEFKPPVRLSMTDEEIYKALGDAQATEDGIAKAMAIVEEQANLREHDNQVLGEWIARMQADSRPQAKVALENIERAKQGLEPLPITELMEESQTPSLVTEDQIIAALNEAYSSPSQVGVESDAEIIEEVEVEELVLETVESVEEPIAEAVTEEGNDEFDALLAEAATEATSAIPLSVPVEEPIAPQPTEDFFVAADEDALVEEESKLTGKPSGWWDSVGFWTVSWGVLLPVVLAYLSVVNGVSLGSALVGFGAALLLVAGLEVSRHFARLRGASSMEFASRATFGVFGAALPGLVTLAVRLVGLAILLLAFVSSFDGAFALPINFADELLPGVSFGAGIALLIALIAFCFAAFAARFIRFANAAVGLLLLGGFVFAALATRQEIAFENIDWSLSVESAAKVSLFVVAAAFLLNGSERFTRLSFSATSKPWLRWSGFVGAAVVLPIAVFTHFLLAFNMQVSADGFALLDFFGRVLDSTAASVVLWVVLIGFIGLALNLAVAANESITAFGLNANRWWFSLIASVSVSAVVLFSPDWAFWTQLLAILVAPMAALAGFSVVDSLLRRGEYHEASLMRSYGFYKSLNPFSVVGYVLSTALGLSLLPATSAFAWLGFSGVATEFASLAAFAAAALWHFATALPRIRQQQKEVAEVESRKASLNQFSGFGE